MFVPGELLSAQEIRDLVAAAWPGARLVADEGGGGARGAGPARYWRLDDAAVAVRRGVSVSSRR